MHGLLPGPGAPFKGIPFPLSVPIGYVNGWTSRPKFAFNDTVGTTKEDVWLEGGVLVHPSVAGPITFRSDNAADSVAGTGAQVVVVDGIDGKCDQIIRTYATNGTTDVVTAEEYLRINYTAVIQCGSAGGNVGRMTYDIGGNRQATIGEAVDLSHGDGMNWDCHYTVPRGHTAMMLWVDTWPGRDRETAIELFYRNTAASPWQSPGRIKAYRSPVPVPVEGAVVLPEMSDLKFVAWADTQNVETAMFIRMVQINKVL